MSYRLRSLRDAETAPASTGFELRWNYPSFIGGLWIGYVINMSVLVYVTHQKNKLTSNRRRRRRRR